MEAAGYQNEIAGGAGNGTRLLRRCHSAQCTDVQVNRRRWHGAEVCAMLMCAGEAKDVGGPIPFFFFFPFLRGGTRKPTGWARSAEPRHRKGRGVSCRIAQRRCRGAASRPSLLCALPSDRMRAVASFAPPPPLGDGIEEPMTLSAFRRPSNADPRRCGHLATRECSPRRAAV